MKLEDMFNTFKNSKGKTVGEIFLYGPIAKGGMWESDENSCKNFLNQIREMEKTCSEIQVRINSEGGSVFEGVSISNQIKQCSVPVHAVIDGLCASIATVIASACTTVKMASNGIYMVHSPLSQVSGNAHDMKEMAKILDKIEEAIIETYVEKCKDRCDRGKIKELLNGETEDGQGTWLTAKEAKKYGFVDEIGHELAVAAQIEDMSNVVINDIHMDLSGYQNLDKVRKMFEDKATSYSNLPLADREQKWDAGAAQKRVREHFKCEDKPNAQYKKAFFWYDEKNSDKFGAYKLPFADIVDGELKAIFRGVSAAKGRLNQTDIPSSDKTKVENHIKKYYKKAQKQYNDPSISYDNLTQEIEMSEKEKLGSIIDEIAAKCKALFIKDEVEPQTEIVDSENEEIEQPQDESLENPVQEQDAKVQDEITQEEPVAETEADAEVEVESTEIVEPKQEEPEIENTEEEPKEDAEVEVEEPIEPGPEAEDSAIIPEVENSVDLVSKVAALEAELKKVKADKAIQEAKAKLSKEVQSKFKGVPGKLEDKVNMIYDIQNSSLTNETQEFILNGLSQLSEQNLKDCEELGSDGQEEPIDKNDTIAQAKALAEKEGISENQAVTVLKGGMTLSEAKKSKNK